MTYDITKKLDAAFGMPVGTKTLDLEYHINKYYIGAQAELSMHAKKNLAVFTRLDAGYDFIRKDFSYSALGGLRWKF